ncbi:hypothetical protein QTO34_015278 [Cnephaeus nilssonii]|uniref:Uncharacterized protein n=1 Tax=Cnephaeus nilssonii TaxID=3371016 RepID=A0AA40I3T6_CNENI|nr:hypothetical protein QTO34_015278 [Eptesicus nilssonii]
MCSEGPSMCISNAAMERLSEAVGVGGHRVSLTVSGHAHAMKQHEMLVRHLAHQTRSVHRQLWVRRKESHQGQTSPPKPAPPCPWRPWTKHRKTRTLGAWGRPWSRRWDRRPPADGRCWRERAARCLLRDWRSSLACNARHLACRINMRFSTVVRRRDQGALGLEHIVPRAEPRGRPGRA